MIEIKDQYDFTIAPQGRKRITSKRARRQPAPPQIPHIAKLMALAIRLDELLETGQLKDQAEIARTAGITRARVTQILNLAGLAPDIQQALLDLQPTTDTKPKFRERALRQIAIEPNWTKQRTTWKRLVASKPT
ncbi:MAG: hypothetical protein WBD20_07190 [Pirellulaceae bacterium]